MENSSEISILHDSGLDNIDLNLKLQYSNEILKNLLLKSSNFPNSSNILRTQEIIEKLKDINLDDEIKKLAELETKKNTHQSNIENKSLEGDLEKDTFGQLIFTHTELKQLNHIPFLLLFFAYFKKICIPFFSLFLPIMLYFMPMILIKYIWKMPINLNFYNKIMGQIWSFDLSSPEKILQHLFTIFTIFQSIYQVIQNALHLHTIDTNITNIGDVVLNYKNLVNRIDEKLKQHNIDFPITKICDDLYNDSRRVFIQVTEETYRFEALCKSMSLLEIYYRIAHHEDSSKVKIYQSDSPYFKADELFDINLSKDKRVSSSLLIKKDIQHFLLSGPNGGGKSSFLRGILQTLLFSNAFGWAFGKNIELAPFDYILSGLSIHDTPGKLSMFQKELMFARDVLYHNNPQYKGFVLFDEIFHSTNPPDCVKTSNIFLNKLWTYSHISSIVSTHVFEIIEASPETVKKICVDAEKVGNTIHYKYKIKDGISKLSSVEELYNFRVKTDK